MNTNELSTILVNLSPAKRIKFIRQKLLKQNQQTFCQDGIVRSGTLKSIESERMKIGPKVAERLVHKLSLEGIICDVNVFLNHDDPCLITLDTAKKELSSCSMSCLEEIRQKLTRLTPINITTDDYAPLIPANSTVLAREASKHDLKLLHKSLCFIKGNKSSLYYLSYLNNDEIKAEINNKSMILSTNIFDFCSLFIIEIIYIKINESSLRMH